MDHQRVPLQHAPEKIGPMTYIMVDDAKQTIAKIPLHGGAIVQPIGADAPRSPRSFVIRAEISLGIYQNPRYEANYPGSAPAPRPH